jgi:hypothetical protein
MSIHIHIRYIVCVCVCVCVCVKIVVRGIEFHKGGDIKSGPYLERVLHWISMKHRHLRTRNLEEVFLKT